MGQADPEVRFLARGRGGAILLTDRETILVPREVPQDGRSIIHLTLPGARFAGVPRGEDRLTGATNYCIGREPKRWRLGVESYAAVRYERVYPGTDLVYHGRHGSLESDFELAPGADPGLIALAFEGARATIDGGGDLLLGSPDTRLVLRRPIAYQEVEGRRVPVGVSFREDRDGRIRFSVESYDRTRPLTIDPVLSYSTYLGGGLDDSGLALASDSSGNAYLAGQTVSLDFPVTPGAAQPTNAGTTDVFVAKIDASGSSLVFATYLGGSDVDVGNGIALGPGGTVFVAGETASSNFPTTPGAFQTVLPGPRAGFVAKLDSAGAVVYSTYLGGSLTARCNAIAVNGSGEAYVVGRTNSTNFPTTAGVLFPAYRGGQYDAYVTKLDATGSALSFSTFLGGGGNDALFGVALAPGSRVCVAGGSDSDDYPITPSAYQSAVLDTDPVITELDANATTNLYSTFLGGTSDMERANAIAVDASGFLCVTGFTPSADFPTKNAAQPARLGNTDAWVARFDPAASGSSSLVYSTFLGGAGDDRANGIAIDGAGAAWVVGMTSDAAGFPLVDPIQAGYGGGPHDAFATRLSPSGAFLFSTLLGGTGDDQANALTARGSDALVTGSTSSTDFPTAAPLQAANRGGSDAFLARLHLATVAPVPVSGRALGALAAVLALAGLLLLRRA